MLTPKVNTKVRITADNRPYIKTALVWQPPDYLIEGSIYFSEPNDDKNTLRLFCPNYPLKYRVIPIENILKMENLDTGEVYVGDGSATIEAPKEQFYMIESSRANQWYKVRKSDGKWYCDCIAGLHGKKCKHAAEAESRELELNSNGG